MPEAIEVGAHGSQVGISGSHICIIEFLLPRVRHCLVINSAKFGVGKASVDAWSTRKLLKKRIFHAQVQKKFTWHHLPGLFDGTEKILLVMVVFGR